jgi:adenylate cyclase
MGRNDTRKRALRSGPKKNP